MRRCCDTVMSAAEGQAIAAMTVATLQTLCTEDMFFAFWSKSTKKADDLGVDGPVVPRQRKRPKRYENGDGIGYMAESVETRYCLIYNEVLDLLINSIRNHFQQQGYVTYSKLEQLLLKSANRQDATDELKHICQFYGDDIDGNLLKVQLQVLSSNISTPVSKQQSGHHLDSVLEYLRSLSEAQRSLLSEVCVLTLVMPATNAVSERSFSALRRVKTYLRSSMTQIRT